MAKHTAIHQEGNVAIEEEHDEAPKAPKVDPRVPLPEGMKKYRLEYAGQSGEVVAASEIDARAIFNDAIKKWPSPKAVTVTEIK